MFLRRCSFFLGSLLGQGLNLGSAKENGINLANRSFLCCDEEETSPTVYLNIARICSTWS